MSKKSMSPFRLNYLLQT